MKYKVIANPVAGGGSGWKAIPRIKSLFTEFNLDYDLETTNQIGHAAVLALNAAKEQYDVIVAAGGDGTINEVTNGLMKAYISEKKIPGLGILCIGRGNDFAGSMGIPADLRLACHVLIHNYRRKIDIGRVKGELHPNGRYFVNCVGVGFDAIGTIEVSKLPRMGGFISFLIAVLRTVFMYNKAPLALIEYDGQALTQRSLLISIMNGQRLGGGFIMAPNALMDDGFFDLCIAEQMSSLRVLRMIPHFIRGTQDTQPSIRTAKAANIIIHGLDGALPAQTDGEIISVDGKQLEVELFPSRIEVVCQQRTSMR